MPLLLLIALTFAVPTGSVIWSEVTPEGSDELQPAERRRWVWRS